MLATVGDQREQLRIFAADIVPRLERAAPLLAVLACAARSDPDLARLLATLHEDRLRNLRVLVDALGANGPLLWARTRRSRRCGRSRVLSSTSFSLAWRGWTRHRYEVWLTDSLARLLLL